MRFIDILSLILSFIGVYGIVFSLRLLLPRNIVPLVSTSLTEVVALLEHAEAIDIPNVSDYRANLAMCVYVCLYPSTSPQLTEPQPTQPVLADAHGEPSLSGNLPAALPAFSVRSDLEVV